MPLKTIKIGKQENRTCLLSRMVRDTQFVQEQKEEKLITVTLSPLCIHMASAISRRASPCSNCPPKSVSERLQRQAASPCPQERLSRAGSTNLAKEHRIKTVTSTDLSCTSQKKDYRDSFSWENKKELIREKMIGKIRIRQFSYKKHLINLSAHIGL